MRPGSARLSASRTAIQAACGPPYPIGTPKRCADPIAISAPSSPGEAISVSASRSAATITSPPLARSAAMAGCRSRTAPEVPGYCSSPPNTSALSRSTAGSPTIKFHPNGSARVRSTASVCGCTSRSTKNDFVLVCAARSASAIASAAAVASSSNEALAISRPVRSRIMVWKLNKASSRPRLIRRVGRVPRRTLQDIALDHRRQNRAGIALADQRGEDLVSCRKLAHMRQRFGLAQRRAEIERRLLPDRRRQGLAHQRIKAFCAHRFEHRRYIAGGGADVAAHEGGGGVIGGFVVRGHAVFLAIRHAREGGHPVNVDVGDGNRGVPAYWIVRLRGR